MKRAFLMLLILVFLTPWLALAQGQDEQKRISTSEEVQVTATRVPEDVEPDPASITVVSGEKLRDTGARDLPGALSMVAGVSIAPGGDAGPASSVPEFWGLREFDAFLLVVDSVPWGGAFAPDLATLDLNDIDRIEILRGAAPVMYGATSFVGVIHVIHRSAADPAKAAAASFGSYSTGGGSVRLPLPSGGKWKQALAANYDSQGFKDDRTDYQRGHALYRGEMETSSGLFHLDADLTFLRQDPASPHPRVGPALSPLVPLDANNNPSDSKQDENRYHFVAGYDSKLMGNDWALLAALTHADRNITKGFLTDISNTADPNATGYRQDQKETDAYLDWHILLQRETAMRFILGADYLYGNGNADSQNFDYFVPLDGANPPNSFDVPVQERPQMKDTRNFLGLYGQMEWNLTARLLLQTGLRFNSTHEKRTGEVLPGASGESEPPSSDSKTTNRLSGVVGASFLTWSEQSHSLWIFGDYRNAFKPSVVDFGPEAEVDILKPETSQSYEAGLKGRFFERRFDWQASVFLMDFDNLVTSTVVDGLPALINAGKQRFKGFELESEGEVFPNFRWQAGYSFHSSKFVDFVQAFDGVPTQLAGNYLEMVPKHLAYAGVIWLPKKGPNGSLILNYVGDRFLNMRNTAVADAYATLSLSAGYRFGRHGIRLDIQNVTDQRPPVSESELGDAQYYRLPARAFRLGWQADF